MPAACEHPRRRARESQRGGGPKHAEGGVTRAWCDSCVTPWAPRGLRCDGIITSAPANRRHEHRRTGEVGEFGLGDWEDWGIETRVWTRDLQAWRRIRSKRKRVDGGGEEGRITLCSTAKVGLTIYLTGPCTMTISLSNCMHSVVGATALCTQRPPDCSLITVIR
eukprot:887277-Prorocentrum_minimum.AAC.2